MHRLGQANLPSALLVLASWRPGVCASLAGAADGFGVLHSVHQVFTGDHAEQVAIADDGYLVEALLADECQDLDRRRLGPDG